MDAEDLANYAINTGEMYPKHCYMAKAKCGHSSWVLHVEDTVIPAYNREFKEMLSWDNKKMIRGAARQLRAYYTQHVKELAKP